MFQILFFRLRPLGRLAALLVLGALLGAPAALTGCAHSPTDKAVSDQADLQLTVTAFHRDMRWLRWEAAAMSVAPDKRQAFLGRYKELGDDFHISNLEIKSLDHLKDQVIIDIEQESYMEPAMIVKKERYIEVWEKPDGDWFMTERMLKDDYKEMKKAELALEKRKQERKEKAADTDQEGRQAGDESVAD